MTLHIKGRLDDHTGAVKPHVDMGMDVLTPAQARKLAERLIREASRAEIDYELYLQKKKDKKAE